MALTDTGLPGAASHRHPAWTLSPTEVAGQQGVDPARGLDPGAAAVRLERDGPNEVPMHA